MDDPRIFALEKKIANLESRLDRYHSSLERAVRVRDIRAINAAWSAKVLIGYVFVTLLGTAIQATHSPDYVNWALWIAIGFGLLFSRRIDRWLQARVAKDVDSLPDWKDWSDQ